MMKKKRKREEKKNTGIVDGLGLWKKTVNTESNLGVFQEHVLIDGNNRRSIVAHVT